MKFYRCNHCGNVIVKMEDKGVPVSCCGELMQEMVAGESDGAMEKHVPVIERDGAKVKVTVGSVEHPMLEEHSIRFIVIETKNGFAKKDLNPGDAPVAEFVLSDGDELVAAYEYCNLHGLWKA
ncbi:MAG: desulfoferrodoxin [Lachnospiraceae bacterium]|nr:desulfoferrodoxin [Lachnospiraceae bacterium]